MGEAIVLLLLLGIFFFIVVPVLAIMALVRASSLNTRVKRVEQELLDLRIGPSTHQAEPAPPEAAPAPESAEPVTPPEPEGDVAPPQDDDVPFVKPEAETPREPRPPIAASVGAAPVFEPVKPARIDWERRIAANWMVWAGGFALALGGLFLVRVAIEAGLFGPTARTLLAGVLGVGLIAGSFRVKKLKVVREAETSVQRLPSIVAGAGVVTLFGATLASGVLYQLLPPLIVFALFAVVALVAVALAWIYGPLLAGVGLVGAYLGPFFTGADGGSPLVVLPYAFAVTAGGLAMIRLRAWKWVSWLALAGAMMWGMLALGDASLHAAWANPVYALALAAIAALFAEQVAREPIDWEMSDRAAQIRAHGETLFVAYLFWLGAAGLLVLSALDWRVGELAAPALSVFAGMAFLASWRRPAFVLFVMISAGAVLAALALWPDWIGAEPAYGAVMAVLFAGAGWVLLPRLRVQAPIALVSALFAPSAFMIAAWRLERFDPGMVWALAAITLAAVYVALMDVLSRRDRGFQTHPGTGASYGAATCVFLALSVVFALSGLWLGTGFALVTLALAALLRRFDLVLLRRAVTLSAMATVALLLRPDFLVDAVLSPLPVFNELSASFLPAIMALYGASLLVTGPGDTARILRAAAALLGFALAGLLIRHWAGGGSLDGPPGGFGEASGYALAYLSAAAALFRRGEVGLILRVARWAALGVGAAAVLMAIQAVGWDAASGAPIFNLLLTAFGVPAILLAVTGIGMARQGLSKWARFIWLSAMGLGFVWILLETRRLFAGPALYAGGSPGDAEMWGYSAAMVAYALALLVLGTLRRAQLPRYASLAVLATALVKVFLFDMSALEGALRAASFIGLGLTLLGTALFYQRFVFDRAEPLDPDKPIEEDAAVGR